MHILCRKHMACVFHHSRSVGFFFNSEKEAKEGISEWGEWGEDLHSCGDTKYANKLQDN